MNKIQKRTLRLVYEMEDANFENLLLKDSSWNGLKLFIDLHISTNNVCMLFS